MNFNSVDNQVYNHNQEVDKVLVERKWLEGLLKKTDKVIKEGNKSVQDEPVHYMESIDLLIGYISSAKQLLKRV